MSAKHLRDQLKPGGGTLLDSIRYPDGFIPAINTARFLHTSKRVLVVGDAGGRDAQYLVALGKEVVQVDLAPQPGVPDLIVQSIEERTPFEDGAFDGVVLNEVLEHLYFDLAALREIRRILRPEGVLALTVPCARRQDRPEFHARIHTPRTLRRLLACGGFAIEEQFARGMVSRLCQSVPPMRAVLLAVQFVLVAAGGRSAREAVFTVNGVLERLERWLGSHRVSRPLQAMSLAYGMVVKARPATPVDAHSIQMEAFTPRDRVSDVRQSG